MERGDWQRAEELLNQAVRACPIDAEARARYAETLWHRGAAAEAIAQLEEAGRLSSDDSAIAIRSGEFYLSTGQIENARRAADRALDLDPKSAAAWAVRAKAFEATGALRSALADYQRSLGYDPNNAEVLLQVAEVYRRLNQPERAFVALHSLIDSHPPGEEPQQLLYLQGLALEALRRYDDAIESYALANSRGARAPTSCATWPKRNCWPAGSATRRSQSSRRLCWIRTTRPAGRCWTGCKWPVPPARPNGA